MGLTSHYPVELQYNDAQLLPSVVILHFIPLQRFPKELIEHPCGEYYWFTSQKPTPVLFDIVKLQKPLVHWSLAAQDSLRQRFQQTFGAL